MDRKPRTDVHSILDAKHHRKIWFRVASILMAIVVLCTTHALILPAVTLEKESYCGLEEHKHTDACFAVQSGEEKIEFSSGENEDAVLYSDTELQEQTKPEFSCSEETGDTEETQPPICGMNEHTHTEECFLPPEDLKFTYTEENLPGTITITLPWSEELPQDLDCAIKLLEEADDVYNALHQTASEVISAEEKVLFSIQMYQVRWESGGQLYELPADLNPMVQLIVNGGEDTDQTITALIFEESEIAIDTMEKQYSATSVPLKNGSAEMCLSDFNIFALARADMTTAAVQDKDDGDKEEQPDESAAHPEILKYTYTEEKLPGTITITLPWSEELPQNLNCNVVMLDGTEDVYNSLYQSASQVVSADNKMLSSIQMYQLSWESDGKRYELPEGLNPTVQLTLADGKTAEESVTGLVFELNGNVKTQSDETHGGHQLMFSSGESPAEETLISEEGKALSSYSSMIDDVEISDGENGKGISDSLYSAVTVPIENGNAEIHLSDVHMFALARTNTTTISDHYYKRVDSLEEIKSHYNAGYTEKYVFVYANGVMQAFGSDTWFYAPIEIRTARGYENRDYFTILYVNQETTSNYGYRGNDQICNPSVYKDRHWQIKPHPDNSNAFYIWQNEDLNDELWTSWRDGNQMYLEHDDVTNTWRIRGKYYYISYDETSQQAKVTNDKSLLTQTNILIFRYVGGERDLTDYFEDTDSAVTNGQPKPWVNYEYPSYKSVSSSKVGEIPTEESLVNSAVMTYGSDPSTANIEAVFGSKTKSEKGKALFDIQTKNDGRVLTDKSIVYGVDDYNASEINEFGSYETGDFSVTLSALGQEWMQIENVNTTAPLDVVYLFDISGSMNEQYDGITRWKAAMNAINISMKNVLEKSPQNRVGLVAFSNSSKQILPLDRYIPDSNGKFLIESNRSYSFQVGYNGNQSYYDTVNARIQTAPGLQYEGNSPSAIRPAGAVPIIDFGFNWAWSATYTQHGIQGVYDTFFEMSNINGDNLTFEAGGVRRPRQPVVVLITDGDPTVCSYNFMDPQKGPSYGQGERHGIEGYYTVLTANYFKSLTSVLYQKRLSFFTIGIACNDVYTQAVLEPTDSRVMACGSSGSTSEALQLYNLLENVPGMSGGITITAVKFKGYSAYNTEMPGLGYNCSLIRGKNNLYHGKYN